MKRRNVDSTKYRKQFHFRKCKFTEGMYGSSTFVYLKFLLIWILIMVADFVLEFRFEFLWPFWLLLRSLHDSFKYQGIIFAIFFASIAFFSDLICYMFLPVQWLFFAASTYVWVQYVWHTEKGICLPTISLWLLFVYIEASFRLKTLKTIDLCRPFAAHCIGYPVVTLGFGFKSYLSFKFRLKKQKKIQKQNDFYLTLIRQALPLEIQLKSINYEAEISANNKEQNTEVVQTKEKSSKTGILATALSYYLNSNQSTSTSTNQVDSSTSNSNLISDDLPYIQQKDSVNTKKTLNDKNFSQKFSNSEFSEFNKNQTNFSTKQFSNYNINKQNKQSSNSNSNSSNSDQIGALNLPSFSIQSLALNQTNLESQNGNVNLNGINVNRNGNLVLLTNGPSKNGSHHHRSASSNSSNYIPNNNSHTNININMTINTTAIATATATATSTNQTENLNNNTSPSNKNNTSNSKKYKNKENKNLAISNDINKPINGKVSGETANDYNYKQGLINNLEEDLKKLKIEIEQQKKVEQYLRDQINYITKCDRTEKLKQENELLLSKFNDLKSQKEKEKEQLEKQIQDERKKRADLETQLSKEKKLRESSLQASKKAQISSSISSNNLVKSAESELNQKKIVHLENENKELKDDCIKKQDKINVLESEVKNLSKHKESGDTVDCLKNKCEKLEEKNNNLQESLRAETRFKMDLFSALGEAKRQLEFVTRQLEAKESELNALKSILIKQSFSVSQNTLSNCLLSESTQTDLISQYLADQLSSLQSHNFGTNQFINSQSVPNETSRSLSSSSPGINDLNRISFSPSLNNNLSGNNSPNNFDQDNLALNNFMPKI